MSDEMVKRCDVFGTIKNVRRYKLTLELDGASLFPKIEGFEVVQQYEVDLSPHGLRRLRRFIDKAITKPGTEAKEPKSDE